MASSSSIGVTNPPIIPRQRTPDLASIPNPHSAQNRLHRFSISMIAVIGGALAAAVIAGIVTNETDLLKIISHDGVKEIGYGLTGWAAVATIAFTFFDKQVRPNDSYEYIKSEGKQKLEEIEYRRKRMAITRMNDLREIVRLNAQNSELQTRVSALQDRHDVRTREIFANDTERESLVIENQRLKDELAAVNVTKDTLETQVQTLAFKCTTLESILNTTFKDLDRLSKVDDQDSAKEEFSSSSSSSRVPNYEDS